MMLAYLGHEVSPSEQSLMVAHLARCMGCRARASRLAEAQNKVRQAFERKAAGVDPPLKVTWLGQPGGRLQDHAPIRERPYRPVATLPNISSSILGLLAAVTLIIGLQRSALHGDVDETGRGPLARIGLQLSVSPGYVELGAPSLALLTARAWAGDGADLESARSTVSLQDRARAHAPTFAEPHASADESLDRWHSARRALRGDERISEPKILCLMCAELD